MAERTTISRVRRGKTAGIISRRPAVGLAAGFIIGALGWLLVGMDSTPGAGRRFEGLLFTTAGYCFLFVAAMAFLNAIVSLRKKRSFPGEGGTQS